MIDVAPTMPTTTVVGGTKTSRYMNILAKVAADIVNPVSGNARLAACVVYRNDIISFGINEKKSHPFQARYGKNSDAVFLHAETSAIKNALRYITQNELEKASLYICRIKFQDCSRKVVEFGLAKPCCGCLRCIVTYNIPDVYYTTNEQDVEKL